MPENYLKDTGRSLKTSSGYDSGLWESRTRCTRKNKKGAPFEAPFYISHAESFPLIVLGKLCKRDYLDKLKIKHSLMLLATVKVGHEAFARFATYGLVES